MCKGYHNNPGVTAQQITDGWLHTGDAALLLHTDKLFAALRSKLEEGWFDALLRELFAPVADEIAYMSENAAYVCYGRELLHTIPMPRELCAELVAYWERARIVFPAPAPRQAATILYQPLPPRRIWTRWALSLGAAVS